MKNIYATLLTSAALVLATGSTAQRMAQPDRHHIPTIRPTTPSTEMRGGGTPANDECTGAVNQNLAVGSSVTFSGDNTGATDNDALGMGEVWETFTTTDCADIQITYCGTNPAFGNAFTSIFVGCPFESFITASSFDLTSCPDGNVTLFYPGLPAGQYYYAVMNDPDNAAVGPYTLTATASACPLPPANDECAGATTLISSVSCLSTPFTTTGATQTLAPIECVGFTSANANDVWFSFVCTSATQTIGVVGTNAADAMVELFSGPCASLTSLACADSTFPSTSTETTTEHLVQTGLTVGTTYFVRVYDWGHASAAHMFEICVTEGSGNNVGVDEHANNINWSVYPNPGKGVFNLQYNGENGLGNIEVMDMAGRVVYNTQSQLTKGGTRSLDLGGLSAGNYSVRITLNGARSEQRLIVK